MQRVYLVSKVADPILGLVSGAWAYYLYESRLVARGERPQDQTLVSLVRWKLEQREKAAALAKSVALAGEEGGTAA